MRCWTTASPIVNAPTIGAEAHLPFGGVKQTGNGHREGGWEVYDFFSETKVVYVGFFREASAGADRYRGHLRTVPRLLGVTEITFGYGAIVRGPHFRA